MARSPAMRLTGLLVLLLIAGVGIQDSSRAASPPPLQAPADSIASLRARQLFIQGLTQARIGNPEEAVQMFEQALEFAPNEPAILAAAADAYAARQDLSTALFYARQAAEYGAPLHYRMELARLQAQAGQLGEAAASFRKVLERHPDHPAALQALAEIQAREGQPRAALATYDRLLQSTGERLEIRRQMLPLHERADDTAGREETLRALVALRPDTAAYARQLARLYLRQDRPQAAEQVLAAARAHLPSADFSALRRTSGPAAGAAPSARQGASAAQGAPLQQARRLYEASSPGSAQREEAIQLARRHVERRPNDGEALSLLGHLHYDEGAYAQSATLLAKAVGQNPRNPTLWHLAADAARRAQQLEEARQLAEEGLLLFPGSLPLLEDAARTALAQQEYEAAQSFVDDALAFAEEQDAGRQQATFLILQGDVQQALGRSDAARRAWQQARSLAPDHPEVRQRLGNN